MSLHRDLTLLPPPPPPTSADDSRRAPLPPPGRPEDRGPPISSCPLQPAVTAHTLVQLSSLPAHRGETASDVARSLIVSEQAPTETRPNGTFLEFRFRTQPAPVSLFAPAPAPLARRDRLRERGPSSPSAHLPSSHVVIVTPFRCYSSSSLLLLSLSSPYQPKAFRLFGRLIPVD